jgi:cytochrome c-type protein NapC
MLHDPLALIALGAGALAAVLLIWFLIRKPVLTSMVKFVLFLAMGALPLTTATSGNVSAFEATKRREFCGGCHVMVPYAEDSANLASETLAARHARNAAFGEENCYACHADYGMFGTITTKIGGMRHVYEYVFNYRNTPINDFFVEIEIRKPFQNATCMRCHSTQNPLFNTIGDHVSTRDDIRSGKLSCASAGCHGPAHPFSKAAKEKARGAGVHPAPEVQP